MRLFTFLTAVVTAVTFQCATAKSVMAHFMLMNAFAYDDNEWQKDFTTAMDMGIDGFVMNVFAPYCNRNLWWNYKQLDLAYEVAAEVGFKLMPSFDMSDTSCPFNTYWNGTGMADLVYRYANSNATYTWNGQPLITTFGGEGENYGTGLFNDFKSRMGNLGHPVVLSPALTSYAEGAQYNAEQAAANLTRDFGDSIDGFANWQAWPLQDQNITSYPDNVLMESFNSTGRRGPYIMSASPWQFKDLNDGSSASWVAYSDTLFPQRFEQLLSDDTHDPDILELLTWNDFCESHYLRDTPSTDITAKDYVVLTGDMGDYVQGMDHSPWRLMAKYYIHQWKYGSPPPITEDQVIFWHRLHPKASKCAIGSPTVGGSNEPVDGVFAWALLKEPATVSMSVGSNEYWTFRADASGPVMNMVPFPNFIPDSGISPEVAIMRSGRTQYVTKSAQPITNYCYRQNFNPIVNLVGGGS